ncbi:uncharacterized protein JCM15063_004391 [Sporobolomyces koalae]|uniref:uncharacterized protein n=1 Tax=Sporobolomyces koalae TaxID=500713 RepID=UPI0031774895
MPDAASPAEVTASSVVSSPHPPSDSAPPPSSAATGSSTSVRLSSPAISRAAIIDTRSPQTDLPARTYSSGPVQLRPPPAYAPNSSVPNFIRLLATLVFLGGTVSAGVAWFYKSIVYPRLILALKARTRLFQSHETKYLELWSNLKRFSQSKSCERLGAKEAIEFQKQQRESRKEIAIPATPTIQEDLTETEKVPLLEDEKQKEVEAPTPPPAPPLLVPVQDSLKSLHDSISLASTSIASKSTSTNPSNLVQPQGQLMRSFVTFNEYLESELQSISSTSISNPYRTYGTSSVTASGTGSGGTVGERKLLQEATQGFKAEIRSIKGALLNRRNFVRPEIGVTA